MSSLGPVGVGAVSGSPKLAVHDLQVSYGSGSSSRVIAGLDLELQEREFLSIVGMSGCGKSTLLNVISGLIPACGGEVLVDGRPIDGPGADRVMVFQDDAVFPWYTVRQNVDYGLKVAGLGRGERAKRTAEYLERVGLVGVDSHLPRQLSGGMRKRVDVARAMAMEPSLLLMDEPFGSLDVMTKERLQNDLMQIWSTKQMAVVFITHDLEEALFMSNRVAIMARHPGRIHRIVEVPFAHPRLPDLRTSEPFQRLRRELTHELRDTDGSKT